MMDVTKLNKLLSGSKKGLQQFAVTQPMDDEEDDEPTIFRAVDKTDATKNIIIKITNPMHASNLREFESSMKTYEKLSQHCNICKLLNYEVLKNSESRGIRGVIVMEHCGMDLFYFITRRHAQINLNLTLSISLDLLNQIICLQGHSAVHGDIKIENVGMDEKNDETGNKIIKAKLVDFDAMPSIVGNNLNDYNTATMYDPDDKRTLIYHYAQNYSKLEQPFIQVILSLPLPIMLTPRYNIPTGINDKQKSFGFVTFSNPDYLKIIDLYSWCYVILILLGILKIGFGGTPAAPVENVFVYRALLAIVMSIIIPNDYPKDVPVDVFDSPINADYRHKLVEGITVLVSFLRDVTVANDACTNNKIRLFLKLIQNCTSSDELSSRFKSIVDANSAFYNTNIDEADISTNQAAFVVIDEHVLAHVAAPSGGTRRRRTRAKTHRMHAHKKGKKASKFKRMKHTTTRRMRY